MCSSSACGSVRASEHFTYTYNHFAGWEHELYIDAAGPNKLPCFYRGRRADRHSQHVKSTKLIRELFHQWLNYSREGNLIANPHTLP